VEAGSPTRTCAKKGTEQPDVTVRLTRRELVAGAGAVALAGNASAETAAARTFIGKSAAELAPLARDALADGFGFASLSIYGPDRAPLYAALMIRRAPPPTQRHWLALTACPTPTRSGTRIFPR
jgi:L-alanine-DL-glutamate epimerase-like enolase superfamily enzyme